MSCERILIGSRRVNTEPLRAVREARQIARLAGSLSPDPRGNLTTMRPVRRRLGWLICAWLVCQLAGVAAVPLLLASDQLCACPTSTPGAACPMHQAQRDSDECVVRSAAPVPAATLASLINVAGVIPPVPISATKALPAEWIPALHADVIVRSGRPESPPPRPLYPTADAS